MQIRNNWGELVGEINTAYTSGEKSSPLTRCIIATIQSFRRSTSATIKGKFARQP